MRKYNGFTLIELLAVILILGIITLIAIPQINVIINDARKSSFKTTCENVYNALLNYEQLNILRGNNTCINFDFSIKNDDLIEIDGVSYDSVKKLNLNGELFEKGTASVCNGKAEIFASNQKFTCIMDESTKQILEGTVIDNDKTEPILNDISLTSKTDSITVAVDAVDNDGIIKKYYYKLNDNEYIESNSNTYIFKELIKNTEYHVKVYVENGSGLLSNEIEKTINTKGISNTTYSEVKYPEDKKYATSKVITVNFDTQSNLNKYIKTTVDTTSTNVIEICGNQVEPTACTSTNTTNLSSNYWYKVSTIPEITFLESGNLYTVVTDSVNTTNLSTYTVTDVGIIGNDVTYIIDNNVSYKEYIISDEDILHPSTFTPTKEGYTFVGYREDNTATSNVLEEKVMQDEEVTLYAVFKKNITVTLYNASNTQSSLSNYMYYNNGNILDASFTLTETGINGWTARGWNSIVENTTVQVNNGSTVSLRNNATYYSLYSQQITVTYYNNSGTAANTSKDRWAQYNGTGKIWNPSFSLTQAGVSGWTARGWSTSNTGDALITYNNGSTFTRDSNITLYGLYQRTVTANYAEAANIAYPTGGYTSIAYRNTTGTTIKAKFVLPDPGAMQGYTFAKWRLNSKTGTAYSVGATYSSSEDFVMYATWNSNEYTWVSNGVGKGATLTISGTTNQWKNLFTNNNFSDSGTKEATDVRGSATYTTNWADTKGCKYMNITVCAFCIHDSFVSPLTVYGNNGTVLYSSPVNNGYINTTITIDVSKYSSVRIGGALDGYEYDGDSYVRVTSITFTN